MHYEVVRTIRLQDANPKKCGAYPIIQCALAFKTLLLISLSPPISPHAPSKSLVEYVPERRVTGSRSLNAIRDNHRYVVRKGDIVVAALRKPAVLAHLIKLYPPPSSYSLWMSPVLLTSPPPGLEKSRCPSRVQQCRILARSRAQPTPMHAR